MGSQPEPYFNPDDPEDPGPDGMRLQMQRFEDSWRQREVEEADAYAEEDLTPEEIAYHRALANDTVIQRLRAAGPKRDNLYAKAQRAKAERKRRELEAMRIGELRRWLAVREDDPGFDAERVPLAKAILGDRVDQREHRLKWAAVGTGALGSLALLVQAFVQLLT